MTSSSNDGEGAPEISQAEQLAVPDVWQLSQLAAMVSNELHGSEPGSLQGRAMMRVELALEIWKQARALVPHLDATLNKDHHATVEVRALIGPLKIGRHLLQRLPDWYDRNDPVDRDELIKAVVGLSKPGDRMPWWKAFMKYYLTHQAIRRGGPRSYYSTLDGPGSTVIPDGFRLPEEVLEDALADQRERGIHMLPDGLELAVAYRRWRLTMDTEKEAKDPPYELAECVRLGREEEAKSG